VLEEGELHAGVEGLAARGQISERMKSVRCSEKL
jgi:hypothetical protein